jgi:hypothetical protein
MSTDSGAEMRRLILTYGLTGAAVAALELPLVLKIFGELGVSLGPLLAVAVGVATLVTGRRHRVRWWQYVGIAVLYPVAQFAMLSLAPQLAVAAARTEIPLGPTAGLVAADVLTLLGIRLMFWREVTSPAQAGLGLAALLSVVIHYGALFGSRLLVSTSSSHLLFVGSSLVCSSALICGYLGYILSASGPSGHAEPAFDYRSSRS